MVITGYQVPYDSYNICNVQFYSDNIQTLVTHDPQQLAGWISEIEAIHHQHSWWRRLIVGLDIEWRPNFNPNQQQQNPVATIQLSVDRRCVVFQILKYNNVYNTGGVPIELEQFLGNESYVFAGVGIESDVRKMEYDHGVSVLGQIMDLGNLAAEAYNNDQLKSAGLKTLARYVIDRDVEKPRSVTCGPWDYFYLTPEQVEYACIDAFVSFDIANTLNADYII